MLNINIKKIKAKYVIRHKCSATVASSVSQAKPEEEWKKNPPFHRHSYLM